MEITDLGELNALNRLLGTIKFREDLDFEEFREFVGSPLIAEIHKRVSKEFFEKAIEAGHFDSSILEKIREIDQKGHSIKSLKRRIDELSDDQKRSLVEHGSITTYLETLIAPHQPSGPGFEELREYAYSRIK